MRSARQSSKQLQVVTGKLFSRYNTDVICRVKAHACSSGLLLFRASLPSIPIKYRSLSDTHRTLPHTQERPRAYLAMRSLPTSAARVLRARHARAARSGRLPPGYQGNIKDKNVEKGGRELSEGGVREYTLGELLPDSFGLEQMEVPRTVRR